MWGYCVKKYLLCCPISFFFFFFNHPTYGSIVLVYNFFSACFWMNLQQTHCVLIGCIHICMYIKARTLWSHCGTQYLTQLGYTLYKDFQLISQSDEAGVLSRVYTQSGYGADIASDVLFTPTRVSLLGTCVPHWRHPFIGIFTLEKSQSAGYVSDLRMCYTMFTILVYFRCSKFLSWIVVFIVKVTVAIFVGASLQIVCLWVGAYWIPNQALDKTSKFCFWDPVFCFSPTMWIVWFHVASLKNTNVVIR